ncbi:hypothetical protein ACLOJK_021756 [Asimina triloba]
MTGPHQLSQGSFSVSLGLTLSAVVTIWAKINLSRFDSVGFGEECGSCMHAARSPPQSQIYSEKTALLPAEC